MAYHIYSDEKPVIRGVLFDMDGLVLDTEKLYTRFWMEAAHALGWPMTLEQALGMRSLGKGPGQAYLESIFGSGVSYTQMRGERIRRMDAYIAAHGVELKPGIGELLEELDRRGIPRAITSSSSQEIICRYLGWHGIDGRFNALCSGKDVPKGKPAPDIYLHGAACLGLKPEECLALEDSVAGIEAGWRAGCHTVLIPDQDDPSEKIAHMLFAKCDSLEDVIALVNWSLSG